MSTLVLQSLAVLGAFALTGYGANPAYAVEPFSSDVPAGGPAPWTSLKFNDDAERFAFVVVGDRTGGQRPGVFERALKQTELLEPAFVASVGDLIEGYSEDETRLATMWQELQNQTSALSMPFFYVVGNHDIGNARMERVWKRRFGPKTYYHFRYKKVLFIALNTEDPPVPLPARQAAGMDDFLALLDSDPPAAARRIAEYDAAVARGDMPPSAPLPVHISDDQVDAVAAFLKSNEDVRWTFVFMHKPAWTQNVPNFKRIESLLAQRPHTIIAGHNHYYRHEVIGGHDYIQMGTTGGMAHLPGPGNLDHVTLVTMTDKGPSYANIKLTGLFALDGTDAHRSAR